MTQKPVALLRSQDGGFVNFKGQKLQDIIDSCEKSGQKWVDQSFPANETSIGGDLFKGKIEWKRSSKIMKGPMIVKDEIDPSDIKQGGLGDCYFLSALSILAEKAERVEKIFISDDKQLQKYGVFAVRIYPDGIPTEVVVDDFIPCTKAGGPVFSRSHGDELWVLLLEKVYAKLYGSYSIIEGGVIGDALADISGAPYTNNKTRGDSALPSEQLWKNMLEWKKNGFLMGASVPDTPSVDLQKQFGLVEGHAYAVLGAREVEGYRLVKIRNPWGDATEWNGDFCDKSPLWTESLKKAAKWTAEDDGTFFMTFADFIKFFDDLIVIFYKDGNTQSFFRFEMPKQKTTQFRLKVDEETTLRLAFNQVRNAPSVHLRFSVVDANNKEVATSGKALSNSEVITSSEMTLAPAVYTVVANIYSKDVDKLPLTITISTYGTKSVKFSAMKD